MGDGREWRIGRGEGRGDGREWEDGEGGWLRVEDREGDGEMGVGQMERAEEKEVKEAM